MVLSYALRRVMCPVGLFFLSFLLDSLLVCRHCDEFARPLTDVGPDSEVHGKWG